MTINLTSAAVILWSGMLIIAGAVLVLSSQVRHMVELLESRPVDPAPPPSGQQRARTSPGVSGPKVPRNAGPRSLAASPFSARQALRDDGRNPA